MGFRTTLISQDYMVQIPEWFKEKHKQVTYNNNSFTIAILTETKFYDDVKETELFIDIQKLMIDQDFRPSMVLVLLHECGGVTRVEIDRENIRASEPTEWKQVNRVTHSYCYDCSDVNNTCK